MEENWHGGRGAVEGKGGGRRAKIVGKSVGGGCGDECEQ